jgi:hypothetical protein
LNSSLKTVLTFGFTVAALGAGGVYFGSRLIPRAAAPAPSPVASAPLDPSQPEVEFHGVHYQVNEKGAPQWKFAAREMTRSRDGRTVAMDGLQQGVYYKNGKPYLTFRAGSVTYDLTMKEARMAGGVQVSGKGLRFSAPSAVWLNDRKLIVCPGPVRFESDGGQIQSTGSLTMDLKKQSFTLQQVSGAFDLDKLPTGAAL